MNLERVGAKVAPAQVAGKDRPLLLEVFRQYECLSLLGCAASAIACSGHLQHIITVARAPRNQGNGRTFEVDCFGRCQRLGAIDDAPTG